MNHIFLDKQHFDFFDFHSRYEKKNRREIFKKKFFFALDMKTKQEINVFFKLLEIDCFFYLKDDYFLVA